jgi:hypothetical protein
VVGGGAVHACVQTQSELMCEQHNSPVQMSISYWMAHVQ